MSTERSTSAIVPAASLKATLRAGIAAISISCFLAGFFLMLAIANWMQHQPLWYVMLAFLPVVIGIFAFAMNARRMLRAVA
jgi:hypothetical protein